MGVETWLLLATVAVLTWLYSRWRHSYWSSKGVPSPPGLPFIGHFHKSFFINNRLWESFQENYTKFYHSSMYGLYEFFSPVLVIWDADIMRHILVKDSESFIDRRDFNMKTGQERDEIMAEMLTLKTGAEWKGLRAIMTPTFTSGKIKSMFPLVCDKADALVKFAMKEAVENPHVEMKKHFGRFTMDTIASCAFGIECNSMVDNDEFTRKVEAFFTPNILGLIKGLCFGFMPRLFKLLGLSLNPPEVDFFADVVQQAVAARKVGQRRGDFLDLMLEARDSSDDPSSKHVLTDRTLVAQSVLFLAAGYETTASLMAFSSFLLAKNKDQQHRLRDELQQMVAEHGDITYQAIMEAKLLDACLQGDNINSFQIIFKK
ncbi:Cytochrome P450 3A11 [Chionoecetes opilio]|uniref:Cytochrome P450 3A11 n=1 Tax=Chionoecetes opilio TaxID=41210 RepID=A0A8J5CNP7_CHIOP|nr:Cytochrome P450 3A11 [Chionoecetes opilio]